MEEQLESLFKSYAGHAVKSMEALPLSGSARKYYRMKDERFSCIGVYHENLRENRLFVAIFPEF